MNSINDLPIKFCKSHNNIPEDKPDKRISVVHGIEKLFSCDEFRNICSQLDYRDICSLKLVSSKVRDRVLYDKYICYNSWFSRFTTQQQKSFNQLVKTMTEKDILVWMQQFAKEDEIEKVLKEAIGATITKKIIEERKKSYFYKFLFYTISQLMVYCENFSIEKKNTIANVECGWEASVTLSKNGRHMAVISLSRKKVIIYEYNLHKEEWAKTRTINHIHSVICYSFSSDCCQMLSTDYNTAKICGLGSDGKWTETISISCTDRIRSAIFSADGQQAIIASLDGTVQILKRDSSDQWIVKANFKENYRVIVAAFSANGHYVQIIGYEGIMKIHERNSDGDWIQNYRTLCNTHNKCTFNADGNHILTVRNHQIVRIHKRCLDGIWKDTSNMSNDGDISNTDNTGEIKSATFNAHGDHALIVRYKNNIAKIYGQVSSDTWKEKASIKHIRGVLIYKFSSDGSHVLTMGGDRTIKITGKNSIGEWTNKVSFDNDKNCGWIKADFSADGSHVLIRGRYKTSTIWGVSTADRWEMKQQISHSGLILLTTFSPDGNSVMSVGDEKKALIYTHGSNGKWELKATIEHDCRIVSANFSPDSNHVVTASKDGIVKISGWYSNGKWQEKAIYKHDDYLIKLAIFINHGRHVMITDDNKSISILYLSLKK